MIILIGCLKIIFTPKNI